MTQNMSKPQLLAWGIFIVENLLILSSGISNLIYPMDPSAKPDTPIKIFIFLFVTIIIVIFQSINGIAISKMDNEKQGWLIVLAILSLLHDPLYFVPIIWSFFTHHEKMDSNETS